MIVRKTYNKIKFLVNEKERHFDDDRIQIVVNELDHKKNFVLIVLILVNEDSVTDVPEAV